MVLLLDIEQNFIVMISSYWDYLQILEKEFYFIFNTKTSKETVSEVIV